MYLKIANIMQNELGSFENIKDEEDAEKYVLKFFLSTEPTMGIYSAGKRAAKIVNSYKSNAKEIIDKPSKMKELLYDKHHFGKIELVELLEDITLHIFDDFDKYGEQTRPKVLIEEHNCEGNSN